MTHTHTVREGLAGQTKTVTLCHTLGSDIVTIEVVTVTSMTLLTSSAPWKPKKYIGSCSILSAQKGNWVKLFSKFSLWWSERWGEGCGEGWDE